MHQGTVTNQGPASLPAACLVHDNHLFMTIRHPPARAQDGRYGAPSTLTQLVLLKSVCRMGSMPETGPRLEELEDT
jgi:hypothetical protein